MRSASAAETSPSCDGLLADAVGVEAVSVVGNADDDVAAPMEGAERDRAVPRLSGRDAVFGRFDAVIGGVADDMNHRVAQLVDHPFVEFRVFTADFQADVFAVARVKSRITRWNRAEQRPDRQHPHVHHALLDAVADSVEKMNRLEKIAHFVASGGQSFSATDFFSLSPICVMRAFPMANWPARFIN